MDWNTLQRLTTDNLRVYEALRRAEHLDAESEHLLRQAEDLLRRAALAYLLTPLPPELLSAPQEGRPPAEAMADAWGQLQIAWADLHASLRRLALAQMQAGQWEDAHVLLTALRETFPQDAELTALWQEVQAALERAAHLRPARQALEAARYAEARPPLEAWLKSHPDDAEAHELLCESHYRPACAALERGEWGEVVESLQALRQLQPAYRDIAEWPARYPAVGWRVGPIRVVRELGGHADYVNSVAFSPDGRLLASASGDKTVRVWAPG